MNKSITITDRVKPSLKIAATKEIAALEFQLKELSECIERQKNNPVKYWHGDIVGSWTKDRLKRDIDRAKKERKLMDAGTEFRAIYFFYLLEEWQIEQKDLMVMVPINPLECE